MTRIKSLTKSLATISLASLSVVVPNFTLTTVATTAALINIQQPKGFLIAQQVSCNVVNIQTGQLALRFTPDGKSRAGLDNGNTVALLRDGPGVWRYVRVIEGPNGAVNGLEGWVNSNYLTCGGVNNSDNYVNVLVFDPPSKVRASPNGSVLCTVSEPTVIRVYAEPKNGWYSTTACGGGWIHESQIRSIQ